MSQNQLFLGQLLKNHRSNIFKLGFLSFFLLVCNIQISNAQSRSKSQLQKYTNLGFTNVQATDDYLEFKTNSLKRKSNVVQITGFSGADYENFSDTSKSLKKLIKNEKLDSSKTTFILGGTTDGIGKLYENVGQTAPLAHLAGMVADQAVDYQIKYGKYGDVISSLNKYLLLYSTYTKDDGSKSWELKTSPEKTSLTAKIIIDAARRNRTRKAIHILFEGGKQSFEEAIELLKEASKLCVEDQSKIELVLFLGSKPGKILKDKGFRAATQFAHFIKNYPHLVPKGLKIRTIDIRGISNNYQDYKDNAYDFYSNTSQEKTRQAELKKALKTDPNLSKSEQEKILLSTDREIQQRFDNLLNIREQSDRIALKKYFGFL